MTWDEIMQEVEAIEASGIYRVDIHHKLCTIHHKKWSPFKRCIGEHSYNMGVMASTKKESVILAIEKFKKHFKIINDGII